MIPLFLAEANPTPEALKSFFEVITYIALFIAAVTHAWKNITGKSGKTEISGQPLEVKPFPGVVTRKEWDETHGRISRERREVDAEIRRVEQAADKRAEVLSGDLKSNTALTQAMSGEVKQINQNVSLILNSLTRK